jgi:hypothetical protein
MWKIPKFTTIVRISMNSLKTTGSNVEFNFFLHFGHLKISVSFFNDDSANAVCSLRQGQEVT